MVSLGLGDGVSGVLRSASKVVLQVPSDVASHAEVETIVDAISKLIPNTASVYFSAGASFPDCCINYVAAAHVDADTIVKLEPNCCPPDLDSPARVLVIGRRSVQQLPDQQKIICQLLQMHGDEATVSIVSDRRVCSEGVEAGSPPLPSGGARIRQVDLLEAKSSPGETFVSVNLARWKLNLLALLVRGNAIMELCQDGLVPFNGNKVVAKRFARLERLRTCQGVGILIQRGTSAMNRLAGVLSRAAGTAGMAAYLISSEEVSSTKLGNFPSIDAWVVLGCHRAIFDDDGLQDYPGVLVTAFEFLCFCGAFDFWTDQYTLDPEVLLERAMASKGGDVGQGAEAGRTAEECQDLVHLNSSYSMMAMSRMTFQGVEASPDGDMADVEIQTGRFGTPRSYSEI